jgi:ornithine cyclodeaminase/alanine dehydrogenase-like protein (mu-crystallin family)
MELRILTAADIRAALPMRTAIDAVGKAFGQFSAGTAEVPLRTRLHTEKGVTLLMPAYLSDSRDLAVKIVSVYGENPTLGLPTVAALVQVLDPDTGMPMAILEGDTLTALRTGAAGGLATDLLARAAATRLALFGAGVQSRSQLQAAMAVRNISRVDIVDLNPDAAHKLADDIATWPGAPEVFLAADATAAVKEADIVVAATTSRVPLFDGRDLRPGTHVTGVGAFTPEMQEIDAATIRRARVIVDSREACLAEAGDIIAAMTENSAEADISAVADISAEIGEIVNGSKPGRQNEEEITFFKSVGIAAQDAAAAGAVLAAAEEKGLGQLIRLA